MTIHSITKHITYIDTPHKMLSVQLGARMTVVTLSNGMLWLHSPIPITQQIKEFLNSIGEVSYIIAPNIFHKTFLLDCANQYPSAELYGVEGLNLKGFKGKSLEKEISTWSPDLEGIHIKGMPKCNEVVFYHASSKTLILTDLLFNLNQKSGWSKWILTLYGAHNRCCTTVLFKSLIKDKGAFKSSIRQLLSLDIHTIILSHGECLSGQNISKGINALEGLLTH